MPLIANPFGEGNSAIGVTVGSGSVSYTTGGFRGAYIEDYYIFGFSAEYYVFENIALGLGYRGWFGGTPVIHQGSIPLTYYIPTDSKFRPYIGGLYRYTYLDDTLYDSYSSIGARAGLAILMNNGYAGFGWVQEYRLDSTNLSDDSSGYPEVVIGFSF